MLAGDEIRMRYHTSANFKAMTDQMTQWLQAGYLTTHDLAQLAVLAAQIYAERNAAPITIVLKDDTTPHD